MNRESVKGGKVNIGEGLPPKVTEEAVRIILRYCDPDKIVAFGSRARGKFEKGSDIDIAVDCESDVGFLRTVLNEDVRTLVKFDVVNLRTVSESLKSEIDREGVVLYEKG